MEPRKLLEYYYNLILFRPEYPAAKKADHIVTDERTYVPYESIFGGVAAEGYNIYIGSTDTQSLVRAMGETQDDAPVLSYLCMIRTDKRGYYIPNSFYLAPVMFALAKMIKERTTGTLLDLTLINRANDDMDEFLTTFDRKLEYRELTEVFNYVVNKLNLSEFFTDFKALIRERDIYGHNVADGQLMDMETILSSQKNSERLDLTAQHIGAVLKNASPLEEDYTPARVREMTSPEKNPLSMWPGHDRLSLREQLILNQIVHGPDKPLAFHRMIRDKHQFLRLMPEIMTASLVERAAAMTRFSRPDDAFSEVAFRDNKEFASAYHLPEERLLNQSVFLLSKDASLIDALEKRVDTVMTTFRPGPYLQVGGKNLMVQRFDSNQDVIRFVRDAYKGDGNGLARQLNAPLDWETARKDFRESLDLIVRKREEIMSEYRTTFGYQELLEKGSAAALRMEELQSRIESSEASREFKEREMEKRQASLDEHDLQLQELQNEMGFLKRFLKFFFKKDAQVIQYEEKAAAHKTLQDELEAEKRELNLVLTEYHGLKDEYAQVEADYESRQTQLKAASASIAQYRGKYGKAFTDEEILHRLVRENLKQDTAVWLSEEYNDLRKTLLTQALNVHRAFLANSRSFKTDLQLFAMVLEGRIQDQELDKIYVDLLKVVSMMTPILSIASDYQPYFLSVARLDEFRHLYIPEASALPLAEASGCLWKFRHITAFALGKDHWTIPDTPHVIARNLSTRLLGMREPDLVDVSLADVLNVIQ